MIESVIATPLDLNPVIAIVTVLLRMMESIELMERTIDSMETMEAMLEIVESMESAITMETSVMMEMKRVVMIAEFRYQRKRTADC